MEIYLIRHTSVDVGDGFFYGQSDVGLSPRFEEEVNQLRKKISFDNKTIFYSSPLKRCLLLTQELTPYEIIVDSRLMEQNFGDWELKEWKELDQKHLNEWLDDFVNLRAPQGESYLDLYQRVSNFFSEIIRKNHENIVIVSHAGVIRSIIAHILEIPLKNIFIIEIDYGSISKFRINFDKKNNPFYKILYINK